MKISYDAKTDTLRISFGDTLASTQISTEGSTAESIARVPLADIEIPDALKRLGNLSLLRHVCLEGLGPPVSKGKPPSTVVAPHIVLDERGRAWVDDTNTKVVEIVLAKIGHGLSPDEIHQEYPHLSLAQIHAALSFYYDHKAEFDEEIEKQQREYQSLRAAQGNDTPLHRKLRAADHLP
jgi:uncharacterized protein (DUF433 family)